MDKLEQAMKMAEKTWDELQDAIVFDSSNQVLIKYLTERLSLLEDRITEYTTKETQ